MQHTHKCSSNINPNASDTIVKHWQGAVFCRMSTSYFYFSQVLGAGLTYLLVVENTLKDQNTSSTTVHEVLLGKTSQKHCCSRCSCCGLDSWIYCTLTWLTPSFLFFFSTDICWSTFLLHWPNCLCLSFWVTWCFHLSQWISLSLSFAQ